MTILTDDDKSLIDTLTYFLQRVSVHDELGLEIIDTDDLLFLGGELMPKLLELGPRLDMDTEEGQVLAKLIGVVGLLCTTPFFNDPDNPEPLNPAIVRKYWEVRGEWLDFRLRELLGL